jgi:hypothetical protein
MSWNIFKKENQVKHNPNLAKEDIISAIEILNSIKENIIKGSEFLWTSYENAEELNTEINSIILRLEQQDLKAISDAYVHFLPTSTFQEHSMMNNWTEKYMRLAKKFDNIYERNNPCR